MIVLLTNHPPLAQACSLCQIHNSKFSPRPTCPICPTRPTSPIIARVAHPPRWLKLAACAQFTIHNSQFTIHNSKFTIQNSKFKIQNSKFKIQNSHSHYRLKKRLFLWWVKGNSRAVLSNSFVFSY